MKQLSKIIINSIFILCMITLYLLIRTKASDTITRSQLPLNENWTVTVNETLQEGSDLRDIFFPVTNRGDHVELTTILPDVSIVRPALQFKIYHSAITVYVDGNEIYRYGYEVRDQGRMLGSGYHWISLPDDYKQKELKIYFDVTEDNAYTSIEDIIMLPEKDIARNLLLNNIIEIVIGIFLFAASILGASIVLFFQTNKKEYRILFWIMLFSLCISFWILTSYGMIQIIISNYNVLSYLEYLSLYMAPIPVLLFISENQNRTYPRLLIRIFTAIMVIFFVTAILLNEFTGFHLSKGLPLFHILCFGILSLTIMCIIYTWKTDKKKSDQILLRGLSIMIIFIFLDMVRFNIDKYIHPENVNLSNSIVPIGVLFFVMIMVTSYIHMLLSAFYENVEKQTLMQIAYTDALTQIGNRAMCEKIFHEHDIEKKPATIINFDLNHFKEVNDAYGHSVGDQLLIAFAQILQENYSEKGFVGRMGGDEFIAVLDNNDASYVKKTISSLLKRIEQFNKTENQPYTISVAYGFCTNKDHIDVSLWELYQNSDQKMYEHKIANRNTN